jgi:hypothetical protein
VGLIPGTVYWMDESDASYYIHEKNENKGSQIGHTKKIPLKGRFYLETSFLLDFDHNIFLMSRVCNPTHQYLKHLDYVLLVY